ncbi:MAG: Hpt domain-containing protein [Salinarimonas sp.]|nr:Hpt domain-containing protein [Salinarimonas sp.]
MAKTAAASGRDMPLLDADYLATATFGDDALACELLGLFDGQCDALAPVIAGESGVLQVRIDAAHTLKGGARAIGALAVADAAERVESGLRAQGALIKEEWVRLESAMRATRAVIAQRAGA